MSTHSVLVQDRGPVRVVTLNRPDKRNAIDIPVRLELADALETAGTGNSTRVIVLTGAGSTFCSGGDITSMERMSPDRAMERAQLAQRVIRAIWNTGKPVVAAVEGSAFGAGVALAAACDRVVAASDTRFATTFTNVGLAGDMGTFASLPARIGVARTRQMLMMPAPIDAHTALEIGLIDALAEPGMALAVALADAERLAAGPTHAYGVIKSLLAAGSALSRFELLELEARYQAQLFDSDDFAEGIAAFRAKRPPQFGTVPT
ncbi:enoyl-CoA hydratase/isomerase family protein [Mycobacterium avium]|uniref:enoyl-CoA hydratase/isomerase family protein n=1 Tax=Mycobacterium avium TaxID=1764 RepID=UPI000A010E90|nr:enoyl-CoA hydratase-related protein [Mycobacterium avium]